MPDTLFNIGYIIDNFFSSAFFLFKFSFTKSSIIIPKIFIDASPTVPYNVWSLDFPSITKPATVPTPTPDNYPTANNTPIIIDSKAGKANSIENSIINGIPGIMKRPQAIIYSKATKKLSSI